MADSFYTAPPSAAVPEDVVQHGEYDSLDWELAASWPATTGGTLFTSNSATPTTEGVDGDWYYYFTGGIATIYKKEAGSWVVQNLPGGFEGGGTAPTSGYNPDDRSGWVVFSTFPPVTNGDVAELYLWTNVAYPLDGDVLTWDGDTEEWVNAPAYENPDAVLLEAPGTTATWPSGGSILAGPGVPGGGTGVDGDWYFNIAVSPAQLYGPKTGGTWTGPHAFTYSTQAPTAEDVDGADYWVQGDGLGGAAAVYGPRTLASLVQDGDVIAWDDTAGAWEAIGTVVKTDQANTWTVGGQFIDNDDAAVVPLTIQGAPGQSANLLVVETSDGTDRFTISDAGYTTTANVQAAGGVRVGTAVSYTTNQKWVSLDNTPSAPAAAASGAIIYAEGGELRARSVLANVGLTALVVRTITAAHTLEGIDQGALVVLNSASNFDLTVPAEASTNFPVGTRIMVATQSTGHLTVVGAAGVTVTGVTVLNTAGTVGTLVKVAADTWLVHH